MSRTQSAWLLGLGCLVAVVGCEDKLPSVPDAVVGFGNEPGWQVEINREGVIFHGNYGQEVTSYPFELPRRVDGGWEYTTTGEDGEILRIGVREGGCQDSMADATYPFSVMVLKGESEYRGCGKLQTD